MMRVHLRSWLFWPIWLMWFTGCAVAGPSAAPPATSLHDRLSAGPVRLALAGTGSVNAEHRAAGDRWIGGGADVTIASGELIAQLEGDRLVTDTFGLAFDPIELPPSLFGRPASLTGVRLTLPSAASAAPTWTTSEQASAVLELQLDLAWSITIAGGSFSLGDQHLPAIPIELELTSAGSDVDARLELRPTGELWSWAALVRISDLALSLTATSGFE